MTGYPKWFSQNLITLVFTAVFLTGLFLIPNMFELRFGIENDVVLKGFLRLATMSTHVLFSYVILMILASLAIIHIKSGLKKKKNVISGLTIVASLFLLLFTGLMLLYAGNELAIQISSLLHTLIGLIIFFVYVVHLNYKKH